MNRSKFFQKPFIFMVFSIFILSFAMYSKPVRRGDGHEYALTSQALIDHFSPNIENRDISEVEKEIAVYPSKGYVSEIFAQWSDLITEKKESAMGVFKSLDGEYYGYHFWLYPAYVASIFKFSYFLGYNPLASFQISNSIIFIFAIFVCLFNVKVSDFQKFSLVFAFVFGGVIFYIKWTHPEVFIYTNLFIAFVFMLTRRYILSMFFLALAAMQVVSLWLLFFILPLFIFFDQGYKGIRSVRSLFFDWRSWVLFSMPASSIIFYYINFRKPSLIGSTSTDIHLLNIESVWSFWFDLDQGLIVGIPWFFIVLCLFVLNFSSISWSCKSGLASVICAVFFILFPLVTNVNINAGQSVFSRYALYASAPLMAWAGLYFQEVLKKIYYIIPVLLLAIFYTINFQGPWAREDNTSHKKVSIFMLNYFPQYYNPLPEIFYERTLGREGAMLDQAVAYKNQAGVIMKIIVPLKYGQKALTNVCPTQLIDSQSNEVGLERVHNVLYGWGYIDGPLKCIK